MWTSKSQILACKYQVITEGDQRCPMICKDPDLATIVLGPLDPLGSPSTDQFEILVQLVYNVGRLSCPII